MLLLKFHLEKYVGKQWYEYLEFTGATFQSWLEFRSNRVKIPQRKGNTANTVVDAAIELFKHTTGRIFVLNKLLEAMINYRCLYKLCYHDNYMCYHYNYTCYHYNYTCYHDNYTCYQLTLSPFLRVSSSL